MFTIITDTGRKITGDECHWDALPADIKIASISAYIVIVDGNKKLLLANDTFSGFERYGFQMYTLQALDGSQRQARGLQILCVSGDAFLTTDINLMTGARRGEWKPLSAMTYNRALLRSGK